MGSIEKFVGANGGNEAMPSAKRKEPSSLREQGFVVVE